MKKKLIAALKWIAWIAGIILVAVGIATVTRNFRKAALGIVGNGSRRWIPDPVDSGRIIVDSDKGPMSVELPDGAAAQDVVAVALTHSTGQPVVEVLHEKKDRRRASRPGNGSGSAGAAPLP